MKTLKSIFKIKTLYFLFLGLIPIIFKFIHNNLYISLIIFLLLLLNELLYRLRIFTSKPELKNIRIKLIIRLIYSLFLPIKITGLIILFTFFIEKITEILSQNFLFRKKILHYEFDMSKIFFFFLSAFILSSLFFYFYSGYITKKEIAFLFLSSITLSVLHTLDLSVLFYGTPAIILINFIDFHIRISAINILFGTIISGVAWAILILLDIIKLEKSIKYYLLLFFFYVGLGYMLFIFNFVFFVFYGIIFKIKKGADRFIFISDIKSFFLLSFIISIIFFIIPHYTFIKSSLITGLITLFIYKNYDFFYSGLKTFAMKKKSSFLQIYTVNLTVFNIILSFLLLLFAYNLNLIKWKDIYPALIIINIIWSAYKILEKKFNYYIENKISEFIPFQLFLLWSIR